MVFSGDITCTLIVLFLLRDISCPPRSPHLMSLLYVYEKNLNILHTSLFSMIGYIFHAEPWLLRRWQHSAVRASSDWKAQFLGNNEGGADVRWNMSSLPGSHSEVCSKMVSIMSSMNLHGTFIFPPFKFSCRVYFVEDVLLITSNTSLSFFINICAKVDMKYIV